MTEQLRRRVISAAWAAVELTVASAGQYPAMTGGALWVLQSLVEDPAGWAGDDSPALAAP